MTSFKSNISQCMFCILTFVTSLSHITGFHYFLKKEMKECNHCKLLVYVGTQASCVPFD